MNNRLTEIKNQLDRFTTPQNKPCLFRDDAEWLIQQAERVEILEKREEVRKIGAEANSEYYEKMGQQNVRYKEALEKIAFDEKSQFFERCPKIAKEALRGES